MNGLINYAEIQQRCWTAALEQGPGLARSLALVLPLSLPLSLSRVFPSLCIINELLISDCYKLGKLRKCWIHTSSHPLPLVAAVGHPPLQKMFSCARTYRCDIASLDVTLAERFHTT